MTNTKPITTKSAHRSGGVITELTHSGRIAALGGMSSRAFGQRRLEKALLWIYRWGYSSPSVLEIVVGGNGHGSVTAKLVRAGLARKSPIRMASTFRSLPTGLVTLTPSGVMAVEASIVQIIDHHERHDPDRIRRSNIVHDLAAQALTAKNLANISRERSVAVEPRLQFLTRSGIGSVCGFETPADRGAASTDNKIPDVIWHAENGRRTAIEIELNAKWGRELDEFVSRTLRLIQTGVDSAWIFTHSDAIKRRYSSAFLSGNTVSAWTKNEHGKWMRDTARNLFVDEPLANAIKVFHRSDL